MKPDSEFSINLKPSPQNPTALLGQNMGTASTSKHIQPLFLLQDHATKNRWVAEAAFFKAEARGFTPGHETTDWLNAEQDYNNMLVDLFVSECQEDVNMTVSGLQHLASAVGVQKPDRVDSKLILIRLIQTASRHRPCFMINPGEYCDHQAGCQWRHECQKLVAEWWC